MENNSYLAYAIVYCDKIYADIKVIKYDPTEMKKYPSYALINELTDYYLNNIKVSYISNGTRSLSHDTNMQELLIKKFKYRKAYCDLNVYFRRDLRILVMILAPFARIIEKISFKGFGAKAVVLIKHYAISRENKKNYQYSI